MGLVDVGKREGERGQDDGVRKNGCVTACAEPGTNWARKRRGGVYLLRTELSR